jgi:hypothetical protein
LQHGQDIVRLQRRADAAADRLQAIGDDDLHRDAKRLGDLLQVMANRPNRILPAHLCRRAHGHIDDHVTGARGDFLRQHRCNELSFAVQIERAFDADDGVISRAEPHGPAPYDAAALALDHPPHRRQIEIDRRQHFHGVSGPRRRRDRARRRLRHREAARGENGDHDRRGAVAGQASDRMLVDDGCHIPADMIADIDHGSRKRHHFVAVERSGGAGGHERREMNVGIAMADDIADDFAQVGFGEALSVHLRAYPAERTQGPRMRRDDRIAFLRPKRMPRRFR